MRSLLYRIGGFVVLYLIASLGVFLAVKSVPGDPVALRFAKHPSPEQIAAERARLGLDRPLPVQYAIWQGRFWTGDWGRSLLTGRAVREDVARFLPATLELSLLALAVGVAAGVGLALVASASRRLWARRLALAAGSLGLTAPIFWIGLLALVAGARLLGWFPMGGRFDMGLLLPERATGLLTVDALLAGDATALGVALRHLALPTLCLSVYPAAQVSATLHARLQEPGAKGLALALRSRGYGSARLWLRHMARVGSVPTVVIVGTTFGGLLGGAFLTETVFGWPGMGRYLASAILERDLYAAQNGLLLAISLALAAAAASDGLARRLDVPAREGRGNG